MLLVASWPEKEVELCKMLPSNVTFSHWLSCLDRCWCGCRGFLARLWRPRRKHISDEGSTREELRKQPRPSPSPVQFLWFVKSKTRLDVTATVTGYSHTFPFYCIMLGLSNALWATAQLNRTRRPHVCSEKPDIQTCSGFFFLIYSSFFRNSTSKSQPSSMWPRVG